MGMLSVGRNGHKAQYYISILIILLNMKRNTLYNLRIIDGNSLRFDNDSWEGDEIVYGNVSEVSGL